METKRKDGTELARKLIIDGNAVYEIDEECMLKNRVDDSEHSRDDHGKKGEKAGYKSERKTDQTDAGRGHSGRMR